MNFETIARPYAQAIYDHSEGWEVDLDQLELALGTPEVQQLIDSPKLAYKEKTEVFLSPVSYTHLTLPTNREV